MEQRWKKERVREREIYMGLCIYYLVSIYICSHMLIYTHILTYRIPEDGCNNSKELSDSGNNRHRHRVKTEQSPDNLGFIDMDRDIYKGGDD